MEKFFENLEKAEKTLQIASHLVYVTYPLIKDKKLLIKILLEIKKAVASCMNAVLQYEYLYNRVRLYSQPQLNFKSFLERCCPRYGISEIEVKQIKKLFEIAEKHKNSPFEFVKDEKVVILSDNLKAETISLEKIKEFLELSKKIIQNSKETILR